MLLKFCSTKNFSDLKSMQEDYLIFFKVYQTEVYHSNIWYLVKLKMQKWRIVVSVIVG